MFFTKRGPRVTQEAAALQRARHPGVVELVDAGEHVLRTRLVDGPSLAHLAPPTAEEVAGVVAALASTLADLHERGVVHGGLEAAHVLVAPDGRPVLCSLGRGGRPADDVADLGRLAADLLAAAPAPLPRRRPRWRRRPLGALLAAPIAPALGELVAAARHRDPAARPSARDLAAAVRRRVPTTPLRVPPARLLLPVPSPPRDAPRLARVGREAAVLLAALGLLVAGSYALADRGGGGARPPSGTAPHPPAAAPGATTPAEVAVATRVWPRPSVEFRDGVLTVDGARYALGRPGDRVVAGDWACAGRVTALLLRPGTGEVFAFAGWPPAGAPLAGRLVARMPGATDLRTAAGGGDGCAHPEVVVPEGPPQRLEVGR